MERHRHRLNSLALAAPPALFLLIFFAWPVLNLLRRGIGIDPSALIDTFGLAPVRSAAWFTFWQASLSTLATMVIAFPLTAVVANIEFRGRRLVNALVTLPFVLPTVVVAGAFLTTSDRLGLDDGPFALNRSPLAIIAAHTFFNIAVVVRTVGGYWSQLSRDDESAARTLGSKALTTFWRITLRRLRPSLLAAASIVFLFSFTSFGIVLILGGTRQRTIETEIFRFAISRTDFATASVLAIVQLVVVILLVITNLALRSRLNRGDRLSINRRRPVDSTRQGAIAGTIVLGTLAVLFIPIVLLAFGSVSIGDGFGLDHYRALLDRPPFLTVTPWRAVLNSVIFAVIATAIATVVGGWASIAVVYGPNRVARLVDLGYLLPLGTSAVTLGFGILITFDTGIVDIRQSLIIIPLTQALIAIPFVTRAVVPLLRAIDPHLREAAATMGRTPGAIWRTIDLPIARKALLVGAGFAFAISLGEFGATSFVGRRPDLMTVPLAIARLLSQPGDALRGQAMALSVILMVLTIAILLVVDRFDRSELV